jgi:5,10-methylene-tetrahydrofolate dehydrogenase/methenyl tetrahydrofolate cyclohydrolase
MLLQAKRRHRHHLPQRHADLGHDPQADVIVAAVGKRNVLTADMVKPGAVVIDVGMNRNDEGKLCGDVDFDGVKRGGRLDHPGARWRRAP